MPRLPKLLACGALLSGSAGLFLTIGPASGGQAPAELSGSAEFTCTDDAVTVTWTLVVDSQPTHTTDIEEAVASPGNEMVVFSPATDLEDGDSTVGTSTHPAGTEAVALDVAYRTFFSEQANSPGELTLELPVDCAPDETPDEPDEPDDPAEAPDPVVAAPSFTG